MLDDYSVSHGFGDPVRWWPVERQNMFTDAVFSIIATIAVANLDLDLEQLERVKSSMLLGNVLLLLSNVLLLFINMSFLSSHFMVFRR